MNARSRRLRYVHGRRMTHEELIARMDRCRLNIHLRPDDAGQALVDAARALQDQETKLGTVRELVGNARASAEADETDGAVSGAVKVYEGGEEEYEWDYWAAEAPAVEESTDR